MFSMFFILFVVVIVIVVLLFGPEIVRVYFGDQVCDRCVKRIHERFGIQTDPENQDDQGNYGKHFPNIYVFQIHVFRVFHLQEHDALEHPEDVTGGENDTGGGASRPESVDLEYSQ